MLTVNLIFNKILSEHKIIKFVLKRQLCHHSCKETIIFRKSIQQIHVGGLQYSKNYGKSYVGHILNTECTIIQIKLGYDQASIIRNSAIIHFLTQCVVGVGGRREHENYRHKYTWKFFREKHR